jgi:phage shock protein A
VQAILDRALADIKPVWNNLQPQYNRAVDELRDWHEVALLAMQQGKEPVARRAIARKLAAKERAQALKVDLDRLAEMTETLLRNAKKIS